VSWVLTLEFHFGLPSKVPDIEGRGNRFPVGVAELCRDTDSLLGGVPYADERVISPFRGSWLDPTGALTFRLRPGCGRWLLPGRNLPFFPGVEGSISLLSPVITTDEAGELPGVPFMLPMVDRSFETILEMESLSC